MPTILMVTDGVPRTALEGLVATLDTQVSPIEFQVVHGRAVETPQWVTVLVDALSWDLVFKFVAVRYFGKLAECAGEDTWKARSKLLRPLAKLPHSLLHALAKEFVALQAILGQRVPLRIGLPVTGNPFGATVTVSSTDEEDVGFMLACIGLQAGALSDLLARHQERGKGPIGAVTLRLRDDGALVVTWMDRDTESHEEQLPLELPADEESLG